MFALHGTISSDGVCVLLMGILTVEISEGLCLLLPLLEDLDDVSHGKGIVLFMYPRGVIHFALFI